MWFKCTDCGHIFEEGEEARWTEDLGECFGSPARQEMSGCPNCHGNYEEIHRCKICGMNWANPEEYYGEDVCDDCIEDCLTYETALAYMKDVDALIEFFFYYFGEETSISENADLQAEIEQWYLRQTTLDKIMNSKKFYNVVKEFIFDDKGCWAEFIIENQKKDEVK